MIWEMFQVIAVWAILIVTVGFLAKTISKRLFDAQNHKCGVDCGCANNKK